ncbi:hypothetical protein [Coraliomargarita parva]|uniref:hypothetical protein n=1 Tax=Coraliomargarita parva TaxID=3014050 RepID=UPI0022B33919|nr:hypothetical protein [Coraliomargarita parva]
MKPRTHITIICAFVFLAGTLTGTPGGEDWTDNVSMRHQFVEDFDHDGDLDLLRSQPVSSFGNAGGGFKLYLREGDHYEEAGMLFAHPKAVALEHDWRQSRIWVYLRGGGNVGKLGYHVLRDEVLGEFQGIEINPGDGGTELSNALLDTIMDSASTIHSTLVQTDGAFPRVPQADEGNDAHHGPFAVDAQVSRVHLRQLEPASDEADASHPQYLFTVPGQTDRSLLLIRRGEGWTVELTVNGETALKPTLFSSYGTVGVITARTADLNKDGVEDYVIESYSGGCGLASGHCNVGFVLSSGEAYELTTVTTLFPDEGDFVLLGGEPYFIHTTLLGVEACEDGRGHNFWVYNLFGFENGSIQVANTADPAFPKTVWYSFRPNHSETTLLTDAQKAILWQQSLSAVYWKP